MRVVAATATEKATTVGTAAIRHTLSPMRSSDAKKGIVAAVVGRFVDENQLVLAKHTSTATRRAVATRAVPVSVRAIVAAHARILLGVIF